MNIPEALHCNMVQIYPVQGINNETAKEKYLRLLKEQSNILQKVSINDIASYLGVTRRTLSRIRQEITK